jgi:SAM-dependent methyltransferase
MGRWSRRLAREFIGFARVSNDASVLDVGAGTGSLSLTLAEMQPAVHITGIDRSRDYVELARSRAPSNRVRFLVGDAHAIEQPDAAFDAALSLLCLNFVPDPARAIAEMMRVTRPRGCVAAAVWDYGDGMEMLHLFWQEAVALDSGARVPDEHRMPLCGPGELPAAWVAAGLEDVEDRALGVELPFVSFDDYWQPFLGGQGPAGAYVKTLAAPARERLAARLRTRLLGGSSAGQFTLHARAWAARGIVPAAAGAVQNP